MPGRDELGKNWWISLTLVGGLLVLGAAYAVHVGSTERWRETDCVLVGTRVVKEVVPPAPVRSHVVIMYRGEYRLRYTVGGNDYYVWASSGWADPEERFVEAKMDALPERCYFRIRYNPARPSEAVAVYNASP